MGAEYLSGGKVAKWHFYFMKDAFYFPHFSNTRHDRRIMRMEKELGLEAYAIYFKILEILREQPEFRYPLNDLDLLADEVGSTEQKVRVVVCNYTLFQVDPNQMFFSISFNESMEPYLKMREQRKMAGKRSAVQRSLNGRSTVVEQSKVNESKLKESKVNETKEKDIAWFKSHFDELFLEQLKMIHKDKDIDRAIQESYVHLLADGIDTADTQRCKKLLNTWLINTKGGRVVSDEDLFKNL